ncbi:MAG: hypothetical protein ACI89D_000383 [Bermanella sp.]
MAKPIFAIVGANILVGLDEGHPLVVLAPVFQPPPGAVITFGAEARCSLRDFAGMRIDVSASD